MKKSVCISALVVFLFGLVAAAQSQKIDLSGTWVGYAERMGSQDGITLVLEKKEGVYQGKLTDEMGMFPGVEIRDLVLKEDVVTFEFDGGTGSSESFTLKAEMTLSGDSLKGTWKMVGVDQETGAFELSRKK